MFQWLPNSIEIILERDKESTDRKCNLSGNGR
jgi:hypothetical protein